MERLSSGRELRGRQPEPRNALHQGCGTGAGRREGLRLRQRRRDNPVRSGRARSTSVARRTARREGPFDVSGVWFSTLGDYPVPDIAFDEEGHCRAENVAPGYYNAQLVFYDGSSVGFFVDLRPGEDWSIEFPFAPGATIPVQAVPAEGAALPEGLVGACNFVTPAGASISRAIFLDESGAGVINHIPDGPAAVTIMTQAGSNRLGSVRVDVGADREQPVEVVLDGRRLTIEAIDSSGDSLDQG